GHLEHFDVVDDLARMPVYAERKKRLAVGPSGGQPDVIAPDDGRRPTLIVNRRLPADVFRFAPLNRQTDRRGMAVAVSAAILRPVFGGLCRRKRKSNRQQNHSGMIEEPWSHKFIPSWPASVRRGKPVCMLDNPK